MPAWETARGLDDIQSSSPEGPSNGFPERGGRFFCFVGLSSLLARAGDTRGERNAKLEAMKCLRDSRFIIVVALSVKSPNTPLTRSRDHRGHEL